MKNPGKQILRRAEWISPSNIALIKYWGKHGNQLPGNASLSMTLKSSVTQTSVSLTETGNNSSAEFFFNGVPAPEFETRIKLYLKSIESFFPFLSHCNLKIESRNSFPHSAGIASSASAMSALSLCLCDISAEMHGKKPGSDDFFRLASEIARLGSGSASRSVYGGYNVWGETPAIENSSDDYAVHLNFKIDPVFSNLQDTILIVNSAEKKISSSSGHKLMDSHPYKELRYNQAGENLKQLLQALKSGSTDDFVRVTEIEALSLHSLMMSSDPGFFLVEKGTIDIINKVRMFREKTGLFICFTLDAGPNVHLLYAEKDRMKIRSFINDELMIHCEDGKFIYDECGEGPKKI